MPFQICRNDITKIQTDAIVCPTDSFFSGSGGSDRIIHEAAGMQLDKACEKYGILHEGQAALTDAFDLNNCRYIIHTHGPRYIDGSRNENDLLISCYTNALKIAKQKNLSSIAFPLISAGTFNFPKGQALKIASDTITSFLLENEMDIFLLVYDKEAFNTAAKLYADIKDYLDDNLNPPSFSSSYYDFEPQAQKYPCCEAMPVSIASKPSFEPDESFSECLIRMIDERGLNDPDVYKAANIDRKHFNHIKNTIDYRPKKETAIALAIGLKLNLKDTLTLLERAGYILSRSSKSDLIIRYCIENKIYNIYQINEILFEEDQKTLGC